MRCLAYVFVCTRNSKGRQKIIRVTISLNVFKFWCGEKNDQQNKTFHINKKYFCKIQWTMPKLQLKFT